ncbi:MAG: outer membrane lipoprotein-sorting protein [Verrucomicrobia bacterium]|nr:outer membrane lipoprotein-sorting protein [Verrucomicrobiota bacterium]
MISPSLPTTLAAALVYLGALSWAGAEPSKAEIEGRALVSDLLAQKPVENSEWRGILKIRGRDRQTTTIPITGRIIVEENGWKVVYATSATNKIGAEMLTVVRSTNAANQYLYAKAAADSALGAPRQLPGQEANLALAGSDFWLTDLGLEFFQWPVQRLLKKELRRGQSCDVLESVNPHPTTNGYVRVVSWIDIDTGGIVHAEAYDQGKKLLKEFDPKEFKKVNGRWELQEMEIRNVKTGSRTRLEFDLAK